ncbi:flagellar hook-associated protein FlgK [Calditerricola satsumensis]|uniref:Flagellar hook-associated protein 1 n=3 Tax=Calditerricola satsumensis TaxID=373054 RepID=A0A8J3F9N7_9BACI|nr:flagellar hook-associated protein FlgK [Calditerricola satsumensis]GGJ94528.1 flagellar hook-associated protein 1 [Calditerricola satsumensis]
MRSAFHGLEVGKRALFAQQAAMHTTGHNIANANTEGYTRQRAHLQAAPPIPHPGWQIDRAPGQIGTGVTVAALERMRVDFLDVQYRGQAKHAGYWTAKADALSKLEVLFNEPSDSGLQVVLDRFWQAWQDLAKEPESLAARAVVRQRGVAVAETLAALHRGLMEHQRDLNDVVRVKVDEINAIAAQIRDLNLQIARVVPHGYQPNDLYDQRDVLLDRLARLVDVRTEPAANGMINVYIGGQLLVEGTTANTVTAEPDAQGLYAVRLNGSDLALTSGELLGHLEARGHVVNGEVVGIIPSFLKRLNDLAVALAKEINDLHRAGMNLDDIQNRRTNPNAALDQLPFFIDRAWYEANPNALNDPNLDPTTIPDPSDAANVMVNPLILASLNKIAAATPDPNTGTSSEGDGSNARTIAAIKFKTITQGLPETSTLDDFYRYTIAQLGVDSQEAQRMKANSELLAGEIASRRESVSGVSLDEEMANLVKFQHAYNAAARLITTIDEMLNRVINGMGRVGL